MTKTLTALAMAVTFACSTLAAPTPASARDGAVIGGVLGGLAAGAIIGGAMAPRAYAAPPPAVVYEEPEPVYAAPRPTACVAQREVWSDRYQAYVMREVRVPCY